MWSMTGAVGQRFLHRAQLSDCGSNREAARRDAKSRPAGGRRPTRSTSRIYFVTSFAANHTVSRPSYVKSA